MYNTKYHDEEERKTKNYHLNIRLGLFAGSW